MVRAVESLISAVESLAGASGFAGVVSVRLAGEEVAEKAFGSADRRWSVPNTLETRFAIASGTKGFTALAVMSLVQDGILNLKTTARSLLGEDLPLIADDVTVEQLLAHRSGVGDYLDESSLDASSDYVLRVPVHELTCVRDYLAALDGFPTAFPAGSRFAYNNSGYVLLALLAERAAGVDYYELLDDRVCRPAGLTATDFPRSDELPPGAAVGYLNPDGLRSNGLHLPVRGCGDGGLYTTVDDLRTFWAALFAGRIVPLEVADQMTRVHSADAEGGRGYGLGFWLDRASWQGADTDAVELVGADAGVSLRSRHIPSLDLTATVISNTSDGAWAMARLVTAWDGG